MPSHELSYHRGPVGEQILVHPEAEYAEGARELHAYLEEGSPERIRDRNTVHVDRLKFLLLKSGYTNLALTTPWLGTREVISINEHGEDSSFDHDRLRFVLGRDNRYGRVAGKYSLQSLYGIVNHHAPDYPAGEDDLRAEVMEEFDNFERAKNQLRDANKHWYSLEYWTYRGGKLFFWLNPEEQFRHGSGWFTPAELSAWAQNQGPVMQDNSKAFSIYLPPRKR